MVSKKKSERHWRFPVDPSGIAAQIVAMQNQALQASLAVAATKQAQQQQQAVVDLLVESTRTVVATNGARGNVVDVLV